jgi:hypothetical protein
MPKEQVAKTLQQLFFRLKNYQNPDSTDIAAAVVHHF